MAVNYAKNASKVFTNAFTSSSFSQSDNVKIGADVDQQIIISDTINCNLEGISQSQRVSITFKDFSSSVSQMDLDTAIDNALRDTAKGINSGVSLGQVNVNVNKQYVGDTTITTIQDTFINTCTTEENLRQSITITGCKNSTIGFLSQDQLVDAMFECISTNAATAELLQDFDNKVSADAEGSNKGLFNGSFWSLLAIGLIVIAVGAGLAGVLKASHRREQANTNDYIEQAEDGIELSDMRLQGQVDKTIQRGKSQAGKIKPKGGTGVALVVIGGILAVAAGVVLLLIWLRVSLSAFEDSSQPFKRVFFDTDTSTNMTGRIVKAISYAVLAAGVIMLVIGIVILIRNKKKIKEGFARIRENTGRAVERIKKKANLSSISIAGQEAATPSQYGQPVRDFVVPGDFAQAGYP